MCGAKRLGRPGMRLSRRQRGFWAQRIGKRFSKGDGFTLIELLVVISIIALLMAILVPTLQRVRKQTKAVVCQSNLRQWGTMWAAYTQDNDGYFPGGNRTPFDSYYHVPWNWWAYERGGEWNPGGMPGIRCCPMATKPVTEAGLDEFRGNMIGGTFLAWGKFADEQHTYGSYGINAWVYQPYRREDEYYSYYWRIAHVRGASNIPVHLDNHGACGYRYDFEDPPPFDAVPIVLYRVSHDFGPNFCINRHDGYVNGLFMDWSVRKIGLKELWTLKWHREFDTANEWTKAGGAKPEDWPEWMRNFKDY
ncbi:MAG: type II secretion system protein [Sedimentisphaerales bacterium]|nr:type II secretion system protein [Sedimentisphaerales bacterium]